MCLLHCTLNVSVSWWVVRAGWYLFNIILSAKVFPAFTFQTCFFHSLQCVLHLCVVNGSSMWTLTHLVHPTVQSFYAEISLERCLSQKAVWNNTFQMCDEHCYVMQWYLPKCWSWFKGCEESGAWLVSSLLLEVDTPCSSMCCNFTFTLVRSGSSTLLAVCSAHGAAPSCKWNFTGFVSAGCTYMFYSS